MKRFALIIKIMSIIILVSSIAVASETLTVRLQCTIAGNRCKVYDTNGKYLSEHWADQPFVLSLGSYILSVNNSTMSVNVISESDLDFTGNGKVGMEDVIYTLQVISGLRTDNKTDLRQLIYILKLISGIKDIILNEYPLGTLKLQTSLTGNRCKVYDITEKILSEHWADLPFLLFPGNYILSVNGSVMSVKVQNGQNEYPIGTLKLQTSLTGNRCKVYDTTGKFLSEHWADQPFLLFLGDYTLSVNGSAMSVKVQNGQNYFPIGTVNLHWTITNTRCKVYDLTGKYLSEHWADQPFLLFPGDYIFSINGVKYSVTIKEGENNLYL